MTLSPVLLTLLGFLLAAVSALIAGGIAWGRFAAALESLRSDHAALRAELKEAVHTLGDIAVLRTRVETLQAEVQSLRAARHDEAAKVARLGEAVESLRSRSTERTRP